MRFRGTYRLILVLALAMGSFRPATATGHRLTVREDVGSTEIDGARWAGYALAIGFAGLVTLGGGCNNNSNSEVENPAVPHPRVAVNRAERRESRAQ